MGVLAAVLANEADADAAPVEPGVNFTVNVTGVVVVTETGNVSPLIENSEGFAATQGHRGYRHIRTSHTQSTGLSSTRPYDHAPDVYRTDSQCALSLRDRSAAKRDAQGRDPWRSSRS